MTTHLHTRLKDEQGSALLIAMVILLVTALSVGAAISAAVDTNVTTVHDEQYKRAAEAAEAGLTIALYRLNMLRPSDGYCVGDVAAGPGTNGVCASSTTALADGTSYSYYTTPALGAGGTCVGLTLASSSIVSQRCITAVGTDGGVQARSQIRVAAFGAIPLFPYGGIVGLNGVTNGNNASINGSEASNKTVGGGNSKTAITGGVILGPAGAYTGSGGATIQRLTSPIVLDPVDPGTSNQSSVTMCPDRVVAGYSTCNDDYRITNYLANPAAPTAPYDQSSGSVSFNATTRVLSLGNNASLTLGGGLYNFCEIDITNNATITLAPGVSAEIFVDSPDDPGSGCAAGTGSFNVKNNVTWSNPANNPTALQIYVYGFNNGTNVVNFKNNGVFDGIVYAPQSTINLSHNSNNSDLTGAVSGLVVNAPNNFNFNWDSRAGSLQARTTGIYYRTAWAQCTSAYSVSAPGAGCG